LGRALRNGAHSRQAAEEKVPGEYVEESTPEKDDDLKVSPAVKRYGRGDRRWLRNHTLSHLDTAIVIDARMLA
jgi:hypothetical protein